MDSKIRYSYDALLALQAPKTAAVTTSGTTAAVGLNLITGSPYGALDGLYGQGAFDLVLFVSAMNTTSGGETYTLTFQTTDVNNANAVTQESVTLTAAMVGVPLVFGFHPDTLGTIDPDAANFSIVYTLGGTGAKSLTFWAFLAPVSRV